MNKARQGATRLAIVFFAGLLLFSSCKALFHPGGPEKTGEPEKPNEYTITFDATGGSPASQTRTVSPGASLGSSNMPLTPNRSGYNFTGWYTGTEGGGSEFAAGTPVSGNITVYAWWSSGASTQYTVIFDGAGGSPANQTLTVTDGASLGYSSMPPAPSRSGYSFTGWYTTANSGGSEFTAYTTVSGNITVYARWGSGTSTQYTVIFDAAEGSPANQTRTVTSGSSLGASSMPPAPSRGGYSFTGWYTTAESGGSEFTAGTTVSGNITVYARWTLDTSIQYTVIFDADGGSPATQTKTVTNGGSVGSSNMPSTPTRSGYSFTGWYTAANSGGSEFTAYTTVSGNITVYARWSSGTATQYTVIFDAAGGSPANQTRTVTSGSSLGASSMPPVPTRGGYSFTGWYTVAESEGSEFTAGTTVSGNITVYARWILDISIQYTVIFDADGGSPVTQTKTVTNGGSLGSSNMPSTPTRSGYNFTGWYTTATSGGNEFSAYTTVSGNITVYARWTLDTSIQYTVIFDAVGGSPATQTKTVTNGGSVGSSNMPSTPTRSGYNFNGWYTAATSGGSEFTAGTTVSGNITVYARWTLDTSIQYTVTFDADGGSPATQTKTVTNGSSLGSSNMPSTPARSGYNFNGWYTASGGGGSQFTVATIVTADIILYAKWLPVNTTPTYTGDGVSFKTVYVSGGHTFPTGTDDSGTATVTNAYEIGETEVTYELWHKVRIWAEDKEYTFYNNPGREGSSGSSQGTMPGANRQEPVTMVTWFDAVVWLNALTEWVNEKTGSSFTPVYYYDSEYATVAKRSNPSSFVKENSSDEYASAYAKVGANGFRLPTSNEWELAARWRGSDTINTVDGYTSPYYTKGNSASGATADYNNATASTAVARYGGNSAGLTKTQVVKGKAANGLGLYDMSGNVWEWCFDRRSGIGDRIVRGGGWNNTASNLQVGYVGGSGPSSRFGSRGFRPARTAQ
jgi:uncharacterized repeat protein (TIGR02543 family)